MGTFEFPITIPDLKTEPLKVSPIVLSTQLRSMRGGGPGGAAAVRRRRTWRRAGGPGRRRVRLPAGSGRLRQPARRRRRSLRRPESESAAAQRTGDRAEPDARRDRRPADVLLLRGLRSRARCGGAAEAEDEPRVLSRPREGLRDASRRARTIDDRPPGRDFPVPAAGAEFKPGLYTCQVNVIDEVSGRFAFPRLAVYIKDAPAPTGTPTPASSQSQTPAQTPRPASN